MAPYESFCGMCGAAPAESFHRCERGHRVLDGDAICRQCGAPIDYSPNSAPPWQRRHAATTADVPPRVVVRSLSPWLLVAGGVALFASVFQAWAGSYGYGVGLGVFNFMLVLCVAFVTIFMGLRFVFGRASNLLMATQWIVAIGVVTMMFWEYNMFTSIQTCGFFSCGSLATSLASGFYFALLGAIAVVAATLLLQFSSFSVSDA